MKTCNKALISLAVFTAFTLAAQESSKTEIKPNPENPKSSATASGNTMNLFHVKAVSQKLKAENFRNIQRLRVVTGNFGESDDKSKFDKISADYKEGVKAVYKLDFPMAADKLTANKKDIQALYESICEKYRKRASDLLGQSADKMTDLELAEETSNPKEAAEISRALAKSKDRLWVGYVQFNMGETAEKSRRYVDAINHYRVAKVHAANMLTGMAKNEEEKKKLKTDFQNDYDDADNRLVSKK